MDAGYILETTETSAAIVSSDEDTNDTTVIIIVVSCVGGVLLIAAVALIVLLVKRNKKNRQSSHYEAANLGIDIAPSSVRTSIEMNTVHTSGHDDWNIDYREIKLSDVLGEGDFGNSSTAVVITLLNDVQELFTKDTGEALHVQ
jgi:hypothetical protein